jgi:sulfite exporter TauE/SafE
MDSSVIAAFITGLTAGGISCFAVQGGLVTGSIARQVEAGKSAAKKPATRRVGKKLVKAGQGAALEASLTQAALAKSVGLFLLAKLIAYTLLGLVLGWLGSAFNISPVVKGAVQILIGVFLVGNALRMFNVHPIFRYFSFEPPHFVTRAVRKAAKGDDRFLTPLFLGAMTVLVPCGVTQSVMAVAIGTGSPLLGAAILFAFVLGTMPAFFSVTVLAANLGRAFQKYFYPVVAVIILLLGLYTVDSGLNVVGAPFSLTRTVQAMNSSSQEPVAAEVVNGGAVLTINVQNDGYSPQRLVAPAGQPIELHLVTDQTYSCSRAFVIPALNLSEILPDTGDTVMTLPAQPAGTTLQFTCSMGMYSGVIVFE